MWVKTKSQKAQLVSVSRVEASKEFGPTGEEPYGTNIFGKFAGDLDKFTDSLEDGKTVYITERKL